MKILSGITIGQLIKSGVEGLSLDVVPNVRSGDGDGPGPTELPLLRETVTPNGFEGPEETTNTVASDRSEIAVADSPPVLGSDDDTTIPAGRSSASPAISATDGLSAPTPHEINGEDKNVVPMTPPVVKRWMELSPNQKMFWFILTFLDDRAGLNHTGMYRLTGPLKLSSLQTAFLHFGQRHESLRTCFKSFDGWHPMQGVMEASRVCLEHRKIYDAREAALALEELGEHRETGECLRAILLE